MTPSNHHDDIHPCDVHRLMVQTTERGRLILESRQAKNGELFFALQTVYPTGNQWDLLHMFALETAASGAHPLQPEVRARIRKFLENCHDVPILVVGTWRARSAPLAVGEAVCAVLDGTDISFELGALQQVISVQLYQD